MFAINFYVSLFILFMRNYWGKGKPWVLIKSW